MKARSTTFRSLLVAWLVVAVVVAIACLFRHEEEPPPSEVTARYEKQPGKHVALAPRNVARVEAAPVSSAVAPVDSDASVAEVASSAAEKKPVGDVRIFGRVTSRETREVVAGVRVVAHEAQAWSWTGASGADGTYEIASLPAGSYWVRVASDEVDVLDETPWEELELAAGQSREIDFVVSRAGRVWGTVSDASGRPVRNAVVALGTSDSVVTQFAKLAASQRQPLFAKTDDAGAYVVHGVPFEREWIVWVDQEERAPAISPPFVLHLARPQIRVDVTLQQGTKIRGRVVDVASKPIENAKVLCVPRYTALLAPLKKAQTAREARTKDDGTFELTGLPPGDYQVMAFKDGYRVELKGTAVYPDGTSPIDGIEITLHGVAEGDHVVFGRVVDAAGAPLEGARVGLAAIGLESMSFGGRDTKTAADGTFRFEGVSEGQFLVAAEKSGFRQATDTATADEESRLQLDASSRIAGRVVKPDGSPATEFGIRIVHAAPDGGSPTLLSHLEALDSGHAFSDAQGKFELPDVTPGALTLEASADGFAPTRLDLSVARGQSIQDAILRLSSAGATVSGVVTAANGAPVVGAQVTVLEAGTPGLLALAAERAARVGAITDDQGAYTLGHLAAATYEIKIASTDHAPFTSQPVSVRADETTRVDAVLASGGSLEGKTHAGSMVTVAGSSWSTMGAADEDGHFRFERVPAGAYLVRALVASDDAAITHAPDVRRQSATVAEGQTTTVDLSGDDTQGHTFSGRVETPKKGAITLVLLRVPSSPAPDPKDLIFSGSLGDKNPEESRFIVAEGLVAADGTFVLKGVPAGHYTQEVYATSILGTLTGQAAQLKDQKEVVVDE